MIFSAMPLTSALPNWPELDEQSVLVQTSSRASENEMNTPQLLLQISLSGLRNLSRQLHQTNLVRSL